HAFLRDIAAAIDKIALGGNQLASARRVSSRGRIDHRADANCTGVIEAEFALRQVLFLETMVEDARDALVDLAERRQSSQWLIMEAGQEQRLVRECSCHVHGQSEQVWPDDDGIELADALLQSFQQPT